MRLDSLTSEEGEGAELEAMAGLLPVIPVEAGVLPGVKPKLLSMKIVLLNVLSTFTQVYFTTYLFLEKDNKIILRNT